MSSKVKKGLASCKKMNEKNFEMRLWDEKMLTEFFPAWFLKKFPNFDSDYSFRLKFSDISRLIILYFHGGIYLDADLDCLRNFGELNYRNFETFSARESDRNNHLFANGVIGFAKKSFSAFLFFLKIFELLDEEIFLNESPWIATGPVFLTNSFQKHAKNSWKIYESATFYPVHYLDNEKNPVSKSVATRYGICKRSFTIHWWKAHE